MITDSTGQQGARSGAGSEADGEPMPPSYPPASRPRHVRGDQQAPAAKKRGGLLREALVVMVSALVLSVLIKTFLAQAFYIPSGSMEDTLEFGDRVMVTKLAPGPLELERGDLVVFVDPGGWLNVPEDTRPAWQRSVSDVLTWVGILPQDAGHHLIKRIIGMPGDHVVCCHDDGNLVVNGEEIDEPYLKPGVNPSEIEFDIVVPEGQLWLLGDNRSNSADSRAHMGRPGGGTVPIDNVVGRAFVLLWPLDRFTLINNPEDVFSSIPDPE